MDFLGLLKFRFSPIDFLKLWENNFENYKVGRQRDWILMDIVKLYKWDIETS